MSIGNTDPLPQSAPALPGAHSLFTPETFLPRLTEALADLSEPRDIRARTVEILSQARSDAKADIAAGFMSHPRAARETVRAIASLTDSLNKAHAAAKRLMPETDRLAIETDAVKAFAELLLKRNPDAGEAVLSALEAFANGER